LPTVCGESKVQVTRGLEVKDLSLRRDGMAFRRRVFRWAVV